MSSKRTPLASEQITQEADELEALIGKATDCDLADEGRYFSETCNDLTSCRHGETGEYNDQHDGRLVEFLWNHRHHYLSLLRSAALSATPAPSDQDASQAQGEVWRVAAWNACRKQGISQDAAIGFVKALAEEMKLAAPGATAQDGVERDIPMVPASDHEQVRNLLFHAGVHEATDTAIGLIPYPVAARAVWDAMRATPTPTIPAGMVAEQRIVPQAWIDRAMQIEAAADGLVSMVNDAIQRAEEGTGRLYAANRVQLDNWVTQTLEAIAIPEPVFPLAAAPKQAEQQGVERLCAALDNEARDWRHSVYSRLAFKQMRDRLAALNAPTGAVEKGEAK